MYDDYGTYCTDNPDIEKYMLAHLLERQPRIASPHNQDSQWVAPLAKGVDLYIMGLYELVISLT